jgi:hypothetical protein
MRGRHSIWAPWALLLAACGSSEPPPQPENVDLIVPSRVVFYSADGKTPRDPPKEAMRLWAPYVVGDFYGSPNAGEISAVTLNSDLTFTMNLNEAGELLQKALVPTKFSQKWMAIEPAEARVARLSPFVMPADGIAPLGLPQWLDAATGARYMLIYVDRPARIRGDIVYESRKLQFEIEALQAGYLWVQEPDGNGTFRAAPRPANLVLGILAPQ